MPDNIVIVESPAKAKTINKYLGDDFTVLASYGHVRDLTPKDGAVRPEDGFSMDWELTDKAKGRVADIAKAAKGARHVYLATDPDREGEAISWHIQELLSGRRDLKGVDFRRVTFNEITRSAVAEAMAHPRQVDAALVEAYLARRALDYLVGFTLSPVLWRKLPGSRSAGRVQSVALRLICEREAEIEAFHPQEYWSIDAVFVTPEGERFTARLGVLDGRKLDRLAIGDEKSAMEAVAILEALRYAVASVERKEGRRHPAPPFTTSTLQQEASRKLGFSASRTMRSAQKLYEGVDIGGETVGLITYMRTDGLQLAEEAIAAARRLIQQSYGAPFLPDAPRRFKSKAKNAQEAHEAIRPTDPTRRPEQVAAHLGQDERRLYELIWKRMIACQMSPAILDQVAVDVAGTQDGTERARLRATGSVVRFEGFLKVYEEGRDDPAQDGDEQADRRLPKVEEGAAVDREKTLPEQHFTQPPPRYTEASLVKRMEELGIGRPSTYASILQVLQDRDYVRLDRKRFVPEDRGRLVTAFLTGFFRRYVEYDFTAKLEDQLDEISGGRADWKQVLAEFWDAFSKAVGGTKDLTITQVIDSLDADLGPHFFPARPDGSDPRTCPSCGTGRLGLRFSRTGAFIGCSNYPECRYTRPLEVMSEARQEEESAYPRALGPDPVTGEPVTVRKGPFGFYVQRGEGADKQKPPRVSLTQNDDPATIELERALALLALPRELGVHSDLGPVHAGIGRYGPYVKLGSRYKSLAEGDDVITIGMNRAMELLSSAGAVARAPERSLGDHPDGGPVTMHAGRYGPYVKHGRLMASLPKAANAEDFTLDQAVELLAAKAAKGGKGNGRSNGTVKAGAAKSGASKAGAAKGSAKRRTAAKAGSAAKAAKGEA